MKPGEKFEDVHLVDDFTPSGTTFIRQVDDRWKGKLKKFNDIVSKRAANSALISQLPTNTLFTSTITFLAIRRGRSWSIGSPPRPEIARRSPSHIASLRV
jgi:hypothetical protein